MLDQGGISINELPKGIRSGVLWAAARIVLNLFFFSELLRMGIPDRSVATDDGFRA
jgi:hypothetical protein